MLPQKGQQGPFQKHNLAMDAIGPLTIFIFGIKEDR